MYSFAKIFTLGEIGSQDIFKEAVEITEKIDGSQFRFCINKDGNLSTFVHGSEIYKGSEDKLFKPVMEYVWSIKDRLKERYIYYGETLCKPKHNTISYSRIPKNNFILFGVATHNGTRYMTHYQMRIIAEELEVDVVPLLFKGTIPNDQALECINKYMNSESYLGGAKIEGIVIRNLFRTQTIGAYTAPILMAKYVSEEFKEVHKSKDCQSNGDKIYQKLMEYRTEARWLKAIQHLRDDGKLENSPRDIGKLLKEINLDIISECKEEICEFLWNTYKEELRVFTSGFPEFYKQYLAKTMFDNKS